MAFDFFIALDGHGLNGFEGFAGIARLHCDPDRDAWEPEVKFFDGIRAMDKHPAAMFIVDIKREHNAVAEARRLKIPVVAIVDTNCDPDLVTYPIAGNDDAIRAIRIVLQKLVDAIVSHSVKARKQEQAALSAVAE